MTGSSERNDGGILLVGDISQAFLNSGQVTKLPCEVCSSLADAAEAAARRSFTAIAVVFSDIEQQLSWALGCLRQAAGKAQIVLLAQMYQEPLVISLVKGDANGQRLADDYLICPVSISDFDKWTKPDGAGYTTAVAAKPAEDSATAVKIRELERLATEDDLTGLKNRRYIWEFARQIIKHAKEQNGQVTLLVFDIDDLKHYNDVYGHLAGDSVLKQAAVLMRRCCRSHDVVGRIGGDEFAVVFWDEPQHKPGTGAKTERRSAAAEHPKEALFIAERFRQQLEKTEFDLLGAEGKGVLSISGGLASFPRDGTTAEELFTKADRALLEAKRSGKNRIYLVGRPLQDTSDAM